MAVQVTLDQVLQLATSFQNPPRPASQYVTAFTNGQPVLDQYGISGNPLRVAHFMGQILYESAGLTKMEEGLNYTHVEQLLKMFGPYFQPRGPLDPNQFLRNPEGLANAVYGTRNGNSAPGDGYRYRGRGMIQLTGRQNYQNFRDRAQKVFPNVPDFVANPDLVSSADWCLHAAADFWVAKGLNELADKDNIHEITRKINGSDQTVPQRAPLVADAKAIWH